MLNLTAQSLFLTTSSDLSTANGVMTLCPSKSGLAIARADWLALPPAEKKARLASLGLSSLRLMDPLDQRLFIGEFNKF